MHFFDTSAETTPLLLNPANCSKFSNWSANSALCVTFLSSNPQRLEVSQLEIDETQTGSYKEMCAQPRQTTGTAKPMSTRTEATANCRLETWPKVGFWLLSYQVFWAAQEWQHRIPCGLGPTPACLGSFPTLVRCCDAMHGACNHFRQDWSYHIKFAAYKQMKCAVAS